MAKVEASVGLSFRATAADVASAWKAADAGLEISPTDRIHFRDWSALSTVMTQQRYRLLRHLREHSAEGVRDLARALQRETTLVQADVAALIELGLVDRADNGTLSTEVDEIASTIRIANADEAA